MMDGVELRGRRRALGLSQANLAELLTVPENTIARWERGVVGIRHPGLLSLALEALEARTIAARLDQAKLDHARPAE